MILFGNYSIFTVKQLFVNFFFDFLYNMRVNLNFVKEKKKV